MCALKYILAIIIFSQSQFVNAQACLPVDGLSFEKIDINKLLVIRNSKNIAILTIDTLYGLPTAMSQFRFFTDKICECNCAEASFHIDGKLYKVDTIKFYSK